MNILIVDDEEVLQDVLSEVIRREGWKPLSARTGEDGLRLLAETDVELVLLIMQSARLGASAGRGLRLLGLLSPDHNEVDPARSTLAAAALRLTGLFGSRSGPATGTS